MKMVLLAIALFVSACAGVPQRVSDQPKPPRIVEEDITTEAPISANPQHQNLPDATMTPQQAPNPQENTVNPVTPGQRPPRRIIWRDQPAPEGRQR